MKLHADVWSPPTATGRWSWPYIEKVVPTADIVQYNGQSGAEIARLQTLMKPGARLIYYTYPTQSPGAAHGNLFGGYGVPLRHKDGRTWLATEVGYHRADVLVDPTGNLSAALEEREWAIDQGITGTRIDDAGIPLRVPEWAFLDGDVVGHRTKQDYVRAWADLYRALNTRMGWFKAKYLVIPSFADPWVDGFWDERAIIAAVNAVSIENVPHGYGLYPEPLAPQSLPYERRDGTYVWSLATFGEVRFTLEAAAFIASLPKKSLVVCHTRAGSLIRFVEPLLSGRTVHWNLDNCRLADGTSYWG